MRKKAGELPRAWEPQSTLNTVPPETAYIERMSDEDEVTPVRQVVRAGINWSKARQEAEDYQREREALKALEESDDHK